MISLIAVMFQHHSSDHFILVAEMIEDQISVEHEHFTYFWYINILMQMAFQIIDDRYTIYSLNC